MPDAAAGKVLTFKVVQRYSDGSVVRWIGTTPGADDPAPTVAVPREGSPVQDIPGSETGPPASAARAGGTGTGGAAAPAEPTAKASTGASKGLGIAALVVAIAAALLAAISLARRRGA